MNQSSLIILIFINIFQISLPFPLLLSNRNTEFYGINNSKRMHLVEPTDENKENEKQNPPKIKKWEFLYFKVDTIKELAQIGDKKCSCGKYFLKNMKKIEYGDWHFRVWPKAIGGGAASNIFHAHPMSTLRDFNGKRLQLKKCVALKSVLLEKVGKVFAEEMRNEIRILKKFAKLKSKRVIRLFAFKDLRLINQLLLLMEMGEYDLFEEFKNMGKIIENIWRLNKEQNEKLIEIEKIIKNKLIEILEAVKEMHKLAIHLDLKPENLLYVKEADGKGGHKMTLKVIDFGGSELIPENLKINVEKRANVCKWRQRMWYSRLYTSQEQTEYCNNFPNHYEFSIKSDIWAVGVIFLKMLMLVPMIQNGITDEYVDYAISLFVEMCRIDNCLNNIEKQQFALRDNLIIIRDKFLEYFNILKATLNIMPKERPTSRGLLDFLAEICQLKLPQYKMEKLKSAFNYGIGKILGHKMLPECDLQTTGNPLAFSDEVKSNEIELKEIIVV